MPYTFEKNTLYLTTAIADVVMADYPGRYKSKGSCLTNISKSIERLGLVSANKQKKYRAYAGKDAQAIYEDLARIARATPIEKAVKDAEKTTKTETVIETMTTEEIVNKPVITSEDIKAYIEKKSELYDLTHSTPDDRDRIIYDAFAIHRKQFYTDARYFLKDAQTPEERVAIWDALAELYGYKNITRQFEEG